MDFDDLLDFFCDLVRDDFWWLVIFYRVDLGYLSVFPDCTGFLGIVLDVDFGCILDLLSYFEGFVRNWG